MADLIELFKTHKGYTSIDFVSLFTPDCNIKGTQVNLAKLGKPRCQKTLFFTSCN